MNSDTHTSHPCDWPANILAVTMFLLPAVGVPHEYLLQDTLKSAIAAFGILFAALALLLRARSRPELLRWHWIIGLPLVLCLYALGSMLWSHTYLAGVEAVRWFLAAVLLWVGVNILELRHWIRIACGIHLGATLASLWAALQFWFGMDLFPQVAPPASTFANRNFFAEYAISAAPFSFWLLLRTTSKQTALAMGSTIALNLAALLMTGARSAMVDLFALVPLVFVLLYKYRVDLIDSRKQATHGLWGLRAMIPILIVLLCIPTSVPPFASPPQSVTPLGFSAGRAATLTEGSTYVQGSFATRTLMWRSSIRMLMDRPWTGVGAGSWEVEVPRYQGANSSVEVDYYAHNDWLQMVSEYGFPLGLGWIAVLVSYVLLSFTSTLHHRSKDGQAGVARGLASCALISAMTVGAAGFPFHLAGVLCIAMLALGLLASTQKGEEGRLGPDTKTLELGRRSIYVLMFACTACVGLTGYIVLQASRAEYALVKAVNLGNTFLMTPGADRRDMAEAAKLLREGLAINPHYRKIGSPAADALVAFGDLPNAAAALEAIARSRPHVADLWANLVMVHANLRQDQQAEVAMRELERLQPDASRTIRLRILLLFRTGAQDDALKALTRAMNRVDAEIEIFNFAYAMGIETRDTTLAQRALAMRTERWPATATDGYFKAGMIYDTLPEPDTRNARQAFASGYRSTPPESREAFREAVPPRYQQYLK